MINPWLFGLWGYLNGLARARKLLVVCDYDGTLAPIVDDPSEAWPNPRAVEALSGLGRLPDTRATVISGRDLAELRRLLNKPEAIILIGGHGAEADGAEPAITPERRAILDEVAARLRSLTDFYPGSEVEDKPVSVAFHYRRVDPSRQRRAADKAARLSEEFTELRMMTGKRMVEFLGTDVDKGSVIAALTERYGADRTVFIGDDVTDEDGFAALRARDVGIKVGRGPTLASRRVRSVAGVARLLRRLRWYRRRELTHPSR